MADHKETTIKNKRRPRASIKLKRRRLGAHERSHWRYYHLDVQRVPALSNQVRTQFDRGHLQLPVRQQVVNVQNPILARKIVRSLVHRPDVLDLVLHALD